MTSPTLFYDIAAEALAVVVDALADVLPEEHQHGKATVVNGPPAYDGWEGCDHAVIAYVEVITPTVEPPSPAAGLVIARAPSPMVQITVSTVRCEPTIGDEGEFPAAEELDNAARLVAVDAFVTWNALAAWALRLAGEEEVDDDDLDDDEQPRDWTAAMGLATPVPPAGGLVGWETRIVVIVDDPACKPGDLAELPDGFLPEVVAPPY